MRICVAIDGPAAAGKSTVAKRVATLKGFTYIDTGAMYRAFTLYCINNGINCEDEQTCVKVIPQVNIELRPGNLVFLNGVDVSFEIRTPIVNANVSYIATYKDIRLALVELQRKMAKEHSVIMDGRDIGTYVLPNADIKIYQIASAETRAVRRYKENLEKGIHCTLDDIREDVKKRDYIDSHRAFAPLKPADDAISLDTSDMSIEEVSDAIIKIIDKRIEELKING